MNVRAHLLYLEVAVTTTTRDDADTLADALVTACRTIVDESHLRTKGTPYAVQRWPALVEVEEER